jgi:hypothetical protein
MRWVEKASKLSLLRIAIPAVLSLLLFAATIFIYIVPLHQGPHRARGLACHAFRAWGWVVGTGLYTEDVHTEIARITNGLLVVCSAILGITLFLSAYIMRQGRRIDRERPSAWNALQTSEGRFQRISQELESGLSEVFDGLRMIAAVDDEMSVLEVASEILRGMNYRVLEARSGDEALAPG